jgi:hypothetical protein
LVKISDFDSEHFGSSPDRASFWKIGRVVECDGLENR